MAVRPDYTTGTLTLTAGSINFTTAGSALQTIADVREGDKIITASGYTLKVATITGDNAGTLAYACPAGAAGAAQPLRIEFQPDGARYSAATKTLIELLGDGNLQSFAGLNGDPNTVPYFNAPGVMAQATLTAFARGLLDDADAATALTTLGVSTYAKTLLDDADASTAQTSLGISTFIKTLLDDTNATTARTTLGIAEMGTQSAASVAITGGSINGATVGATSPATGTFTIGQFNTNLNINTFSATGATAGTSAANGVINNSRDVASNTNHIRFTNSNGLVGAINTNGLATSYGTSSDERLKDFIGVYSPETALQIIKADPTREFTWKVDGAHAVGWGAQTSYAVSPDLASPGVGDPGDEDFTPWGVDQGKRTPYLWAVVPWLADRLDAAEARLAAIEAA